jgi:prepilin-type N-terminal cleavage/methylation domain-containing protein
MTRLQPTSPRGFTLIEMLIVVAITAISVSAYIGIHVHMMRERQRICAEMEVTTEEHQILSAILHDVAQAQRIHFSPASPSGVEATAQQVIFTPRQLNAPVLRYTLEGKKLQRILTDRSVTSTLSNRIQTFSLEQRGNLLHIAVACQRAKLPGGIEGPVQLLETDCYTGDKMP